MTNSKTKEPQSPGDDIGGISAEKPVFSRPYAVGVFDVLGFKSKFEKLGLMEITAKYRALIDIVVQRDKHLAETQMSLPFIAEGPIWCAGGEIALVTKVYMAYASDTFIVWANHTWTELHQKNEEELKALSKDRSRDWLFHPIPCDAFLDTCNELICRSLQVGLPLRGAVSVGHAVMDKERNIFLGQPIIDANILEHGQKFIGAGMCKFFLNQTIPKRFSLSFSQQLKNSPTKEAGGLILDWPRHWRNTRNFDARELIQGMNTEKNFSDYYQNTLDSIACSEQFANEFESGKACPIRSNYAQFSYNRGGDISGYVVPVLRGRPVPRD